MSSFVSPSATPSTAAPTATAAAPALTSDRPATFATAHELAVYIGRFQPFHNGHLALLKAALAAAKQVVIVLGSANQARTPKNPFTWQERAAMVQLALDPQDKGRVSFVPVQDHYGDEQWIEAVRKGVHDASQAAGQGQRPSTVLVGHFKDATSSYLRQFEGWDLLSVERAGEVDATHLRDALFASSKEALPATLAALTSVAPASTLDFLKSWSNLPHFETLQKEWTDLRAYKAAWASAPYAPVFVTVDAVVRCSGKVLLIRRGRSPGKGLLALPGGFIEQRETAYQSAVRELKEETSFALLDSTMKAALQGSAVFDHPDRSLRGRTITHAFYFDLGDRPLPELQAADDAQAADWFDIKELKSLQDQFHDDHFHVLGTFINL